MKEKCVSKQNEHAKFEKEFQAVKDSNKKIEKENKFLNDKFSRIKETHDKSITDLRAEINKYKTRLNFLQVEKKSFEEKYSKMAENYQKFFSKLNQNNQNNFVHKTANLDISNTVKKNDLIKILSRVNGTEKLIETIKNGYNESLRELLFEISALKNFVLEINNEIIEYATKLDLKGLVSLEGNFINMPFMDSITKIKYALKANIKKSFDFWELENPKDNNFYHNLNRQFNLPANIKSCHNKITNQDNISSIFNSNQNNTSINNNKEEEINFRNSNQNNKINSDMPSDSISLIRGKNDNIFENEKLENAKKDNNFKNSILKNNNELNSFDQTNFDNIIDFDLDNFDFEDSNSNSFKINKKINLEYRENAIYDKGMDIINNKIESNLIRGKSNIQKEKEENNLINNELEYLKEKWMKALSS